MVTDVTNKIGSAWSWLTGTSRAKREQPVRTGRRTIGGAVRVLMQRMYLPPCKLIKSFFE